MKSAQCVHQELPAVGQICIHLREMLSNEKESEFEYVKWFDGQSRDFALICTEECAALTQGKALMVDVCNKCFERIQQTWIPNSVIGRPLIPERKTNLYFSHEQVNVPGLRSDTIAEIQPLNGQLSNSWLAVTYSGQLMRLDLDERSITPIIAIPNRVWHDMDEVRESVSYGKDSPQGRKIQETIHVGVKLHLHISSNGDYAVVVNDRGKYGVVINVRSGRLLMDLDRGRTYYHVTNFPIAFFTLDDGTFLVHGTRSNCLDVLDLTTNELVTEREPPIWKSGEPRPSRVLDYFHAGLGVSPDNEWIFDWGWVWHPAGVIRAWKLQPWVKENVWESEDGDSLVLFCHRNGDWDEPTFWADNYVLGVWGYGDDDSDLIPAVCLYDIRTGEMLRWFGGPEGDLKFDKYLYSFNKEVGMSVWDVESGERLHRETTFYPTGYHYGTKRFLSLISDGSFQVSKLIDM